MLLQGCFRILIQGFLYSRSSWKFCDICWFYIVISKIHGFHGTCPNDAPVLACWTSDTVQKRFRSFNAINLRSVGQRAAKLPASKLWEWFDPRRIPIRSDWFKWGRGWAADFFLRLQLWKLVTLQPLGLQRPTVPLWKDLDPIDKLCLRGKKYFKDRF